MKNHLRLLAAFLFITAISNSTFAQEDNPIAKAVRDIVLEEIAHCQQMADGYPKDYNELSSPDYDYDYVLVTISKKKRTDWARKKGLADWLAAHPGNVIETAFNKYEATLNKKLPTFKADLAAYKLHNLAEEKLMKDKIAEYGQYTYYSTGFSDTWQIEKNDLGVPLKRYKHGAVYLKDPESDFPYCYLSYVNIIQDYSGGGAYGESYPYYSRDVIVACPAGK